MTYSDSGAREGFGINTKALLLGLFTTLLMAPALLVLLETSDAQPTRDLALRPATQARAPAAGVAGPAASPVARTASGSSAAPLSPLFVRFGAEPRAQAAGHCQEEAPALTSREARATKPAREVSAREAASGGATLEADAALERIRSSTRRAEKLTRPLRPDDMDQRTMATSRSVVDFELDDPALAGVEELLRRDSDLLWLNTGAGR
jgi:hypothetical protein